MPALNQDCISYIVNHLHRVTDHSTIAAASVLNRTWREVTLGPLFHIFHARGKMAPLHFELAIRFLEDHPYIHSKVHILILSSCSPPFRRHLLNAFDIKKFPVLTASDAFRIALFFPRLEELWVRDIIFDGDFTICCPSLTNLNTLHMNNVHCRTSRSDCFALTNLRPAWLSITVTDCIWQDQMYTLPVDTVICVGLTLDWPCGAVQATSMSMQMPRFTGVTDLVLSNLVVAETDKFNLTLGQLHGSLRYLHLKFNGSASCALHCKHFREFTCALTFWFHGTDDYCHKWRLTNIHRCKYLSVVEITLPIGAPFAPMESDSIKSQDGGLLQRILDRLPEDVHVCHLHFVVNTTRAGGGILVQNRIPWNTVGEVLTSAHPSIESLTADIHRGDTLPEGVTAPEARFGPAAIPMLLSGSGDVEVIRCKLSSLITEIAELTHR